MCTLGFFPTASLCRFRTRAELDKYLEASQIRERAIERINDVTGTYDLLVSFSYVNIYVLYSSNWLQPELVSISLFVYMLNRKLNFTWLMFMYVLVIELCM